MKEVNRIITESGLSKVNVAKYLGVSRQMLYNYLALKTINEIPKDKGYKLLNLFGVTKEEELKRIKVDQKFIEEVEKRLDEVLDNNFSRDNTFNIPGLNKKEQELFTDIVSLLKEKLTDEKQDTTYDTLRYLYYFLQTMDRVEELKYILVYMAKNNCFIPPLEFVYDEDKQYSFEGIFYTAMTLYSNKGAAKNKVMEAHKRFEQDIESKKEEKLSRTQELNSFRIQALQELGYTSITDNNAKEVFEKIAEIMSRKF